MTGQDTRSAVAAKPSLDEIRARSEAVLYDARARFGSLADVSRGGTAELARDVLTVLAECGRLREQLDAARKVSARLRVNSIAWHRRFHTGRWQECSEPSCVTDRAARAALGVVGEQEKTR